MSAEIIPFLDGHAFDPETITVMSTAYDKACAQLHDRGQPAIVREIIAKTVIGLARTGERDPDKLSQLALRVLGMNTSV